MDTGADACPPAHDAGSAVNCRRPNAIVAPRAIECTPVMRWPSTVVPLTDPRSWIRRSAPSRQTTAWCRESEGSIRRHELSAAVPMVMRSTMDEEVAQRPARDLGGIEEEERRSGRASKREEILVVQRHGTAGRDRFQVAKHAIGVTLNDHARAVAADTGDGAWRRSRTRIPSDPVAIGFEGEHGLAELVNIHRHSAGEPLQRGARCREDALRPPVVGAGLGLRCGRGLIRELIRELQFVRPCQLDDVVRTQRMTNAGREENRQGGCRPEDACRWWSRCRTRTTRAARLPRSRVRAGKRA